MMSSPNATQGQFIHPTARIGKNVNLAPFVVIYGEVEIEDDATIGAYAVIGSHPSDKSYRGQGRGVKIGAGSSIGPGSVISAGTSGPTLIDSEVFVMENCVIGHDVRVGRGAVISAGCSVGGHAIIGPFANLGLGTTVHQRSKVGCGAMIGMGSAVRGEIGHFDTMAGNPIRKIGRNKFLLDRLGLKRLPDSFGIEDLIEASSTNFQLRTSIEDFYSRT